MINNTNKKRENEETKLSMTGRHIIKRDGREVDFNLDKIVTAISKANASVVEADRMTKEQINKVAVCVKERVFAVTAAYSVEDIQEFVETEIIKEGADAVAKSYILYRQQRKDERKRAGLEGQILSLVDAANEEQKQENANKNPVINSTQRDYIAGIVSREMTENRWISKNKRLQEAIKKGIIHFHDSDYFVQHMHNCDLINLKDMLENGTVITDTRIDSPHSFYTACNVTTQIVAQVASNQYGGQSFSLAHLAPFVQKSREKIRKQVIAERTANGDDLDEAKISRTVESRLDAEIKSGIQTIQYQLITLMTTNGQAPFVTMFMYIDEAPEGQTREDLVRIIKEVLRQRIQGVKNVNGTWITPSFPKLIYVLDEDNIKEDSKYWDVTVLAAKCTAKRMVPDYISAKVMREMKQGEVYTCMGCRSFLTVEDNIRNEDGSHKFYGRFNQGVVTINLPYIACLSGGDMDKFWDELERYLELCHDGLRLRHERLKGTLSDVAPILWQHGALARLKPGETIDKLLYGGYSTISLGYAGLYEMCVRMMGKTHTDPEARPFALAVMQRLNDKCAEWRAAENIAYSVYGTPMESTTYKFAKSLQKAFGIIPGVTDHNYITNSYHVNVREEIDAFNKLQFESEFQKLSPGGAISYVEVPNMQKNIPGVLAIMKCIYENIMYAELNTKSDHCDICGYEGEIKAVDDGYGKLVWECPNCGNRDKHKMVVVRRICGYLGGANDVNQGRLGDIHDRVEHVSTRSSVSICDNENSSSAL